MKRSRLWIGIVLVVGIVVQLPALLTGFLLDDYLHASMIHGTFPSPRSPFNLYDFIGDGDRAILRARGLLPWWSDPGLKIRFFRPLSSVLLWADHRALGDSPLALHLHSLAWWIAAVFAARALFSRVLEPRAATIGTAIFALAPCHTLPLAWLANREALVSLTFGLLGLASLLRFVDASRLEANALKKIGPLLLAALWFSLSLLGGEYGLGLGGYVAGILLFTRGIRWSRRGLGALSFAVPAAGYLLVRAVLDYGTRGSGFYTDPLVEPRLFLLNLPRRFGLLALDAWLSLDGATLTMSTSTWFLAVTCGVVGLVLVIVFRRTLIQSESDQRRKLVWLLFGSVLSILPITAVLPSPRLLAASMVGIAAIVAVILDRAWFSSAGKSRAGDWGGLVALALGFAHLVHAPVTALLVARSYQRSSATFAKAAGELGERLGNITDAQVFIMRCKWDYFFLPFALDALRETSSPSGGRFAPPARWRIMAQSDHVLALRRGPKVLEVASPSDSGIYPPGEGNLFVTEKTPMKVGQKFSFPGMTVTILRMGKGAPRLVRFETEDDLDSYDWTTEEKTGFPDIEVPSVGLGKPFDG